MHNSIIETLLYLTLVMSLKETRRGIAFCPPGIDAFGFSSGGLAAAGCLLEGKQAEPVITRKTYLRLQLLLGSGRGRRRRWRCS